MRSFFACCAAALLFACVPAAAQDTTVALAPVPAQPMASSVVSFIPNVNILCDYPMYRHPSREDSAFYNKHLRLAGAQPSKRNYDDYYYLACAMWELGKTTEAEKMFVTIVGSAEPFYTGTYYNGSDIPGDTATNIYGYGSFTWNYKHSSCLRLAKIYIEQKQFAKALAHLEDAEKKYPVVYNCGTGHMWHQQELIGLYGLCYEGLERWDDIIALFLPVYNDFPSAVLVRALKKKYTQEEIDRYLVAAETSITCVPDSFQSISRTIHNYGAPDERTEDSRFTSGTGTAQLFGYEVILPRPNLQDGETVTREHFVREFKASAFYGELSERN